MKPRTAPGLRARLRSASALRKVTPFVAGVVIGAAALNMRPAAAAISFDYAFVQMMAEWGRQQITSQVNNFVSNRIQQMTEVYSDTLTRGVDQLSRYMRGQVDAAQQTTDASNMAMARFERDVRNAQIRDEHVPTLAACMAQQRSNMIVVASRQSAAVATSLAAVGDARLQGGPGTPAHQGATQVLAAANARHAANYCDANDAEAGVCQAPSPRANANQSAASLFGAGTYEGQADVEAAHDFIQTVTAPLPPPVIRGDARASLEGQERMAQRRAYNGRISLAQWAATDVAAGRTRAIAITAEQREEWQRLAAVSGNSRPAPTHISLNDAISLEVSRRMGNPTWAAQLEQMPPASVARETARLLALNAWINWQIGQRQHVGNAVLGAMLATEADRDERARGPASFPVPAAVTR